MSLSHLRTGWRGRCRPPHSVRCPLSSRLHQAVRLLEAWVCALHIHVLGPQRRTHVNKRSLHQRLGWRALTYHERTRCFLSSCLKVTLRMAHHRREDELSRAAQRPWPWQKELGRDWWSRTHLVPTGLWLRLQAHLQARGLGSLVSLPRLGYLL